MVELHPDLITYFADRLAPRLPVGAPHYIGYYLGELLSKNFTIRAEPLALELPRAESVTQVRAIAEEALLRAGPWRNIRAIVPPQYFAGIASAAYRQMASRAPGQFGQCYQSLALNVEVYADVITFEIPAPRATNLIGDVIRAPAQPFS